MTIQETIKKAIEGGYNWESRRDYMAGGTASQCLLVCDPEFWKALGKSLGWQGTEMRMCVGCGIALKSDEKETMDGKCPKCNSDIEYFEGQWLLEWHLFIDHLAEGKSLESFFKEF